MLAQAEVSIPSYPRGGYPIGEMEVSPRFPQPLLHLGCGLSPKTNMLLLLMSSSADMEERFTEFFHTKSDFLLLLDLIIND